MQSRRWNAVALIQAQALVKLLELSTQNNEFAGLRLQQ